MFDVIKKFFSNPSNNFFQYENDITLISLNEIKQHLNLITEKEKIKNHILINHIKNKMSPNKKNVFILDSVCLITEIIENELNDCLKKKVNL